MSAFLADSLYGTVARPQPNPLPTPTHPPGTPEPFARTEPRDPERLAANPVFVLVAIVGLAVLVMHISFRGSIEVSA
jgi:hypothetical protein